MSKFAWWARLPAYIKSGVITLVGTTIMAFLILSIEFLQDVVVWFPSLFDEPDSAVEIPDVSAFADGLFSLGVGFITGLGFLLYRFVQAKTVFFGNPPVFNPPANPDA